MKFSVSIATAFLLLLFAIPANATLVSYNDRDALESTFVNDPDYVLTEFNLKHLDKGSEWFSLKKDGVELEDKTLTGEGRFVIEFYSPNTTFGVQWLDVDEKSTSFKVFNDDKILLGAFDIPKGKKQFFGVRAYDGDIIKWVDVELGGASVRNLIHNHPIPTPEPATMLLLGVGLIGMAGLGRKVLLKST